MKIGLDLSVIQTPHRMRGIGATAINFVNSLPPRAKQDNEFVIFMHDSGHEEALELLDLSGLNYELRLIHIVKHPASRILWHVRLFTNLKRKFKKIYCFLNKIKLLRVMFIVPIYTGRIVNILKRNPSFGDVYYNNVHGLDVFLQFDQSGTFPKSRHIKKARILYDVIPYVMESDYLWSYKTARLHGDSMKSSLRKAILRKQYRFKTRAAVKQSDILIAISEHTKNDFVKYMGIEASRMHVVHLGVPHNNNKPVAQPGFKQYVESSWGYIQKQIDLKEKPFLLFVGGADPRRKLVDLIAAFNNLRAQGIDIKLVLVGDTMFHPQAIPVPDVQKYMSASSYIDDIVFLGFVSDEQKTWLYQNALVFVYPSVYEGFGLPILEAMQYGTAVITYKNSSIAEVAEDAAIYAENFLDIRNAVNSLLGDPQLRAKHAKKGKEQSMKFSWEMTVIKTLELLI